LFGLDDRAHLQVVELRRALVYLVAPLDRGVAATQDDVNTLLFFNMLAENILEI